MTKEVSNNKKHLFAIGIPTINRWDLLKPFLEKYNALFPLTHIFIVDNGKQKGLLKEALQYDNVKQVYQPQEPMSVAASWNKLCFEIFAEHKYAFILNDDVFFEKSEFHVERFLTLYPNHDFYVSQSGFCSFMIPRDTYARIGGFDEHFKGAYFEDRDYERRLKMMKMDTLRCNFFNPVVINESSSIKKNPSLNSNYKNNAQYYFTKWGGHVGGEIYVSPFNGDQKIL